MIVEEITFILLGNPQILGVRVHSFSRSSSLFRVAEIVGLPPRATSFIPPKTYVPQKKGGVGRTTVFLAFFGLL